MKKIEKEDWYTTGLAILEKEGFSRITIENLCLELSITKGSFYHHFGNIDGYIESLMKYWLQKNTISFIEKSETGDNTPVRKFEMLLNTVTQSSYSAEQVIRAWSYSNPIVKKFVAKTDELRLSYITSLNETEGLENQMAHNMAVLKYAILIGMQQLSPDSYKTQLKEIYSMLVQRNSIL